MILACLDNYNDTVGINNYWKSVYLVKAVQEEAA